MNRSSGSPVRFPITVIWVSPAMCVPLVSFHAGVVGMSERGLVGVRPQQLESKHGLVETQLTLEFLGGCGLRGEVDHRVDSVALLLDGICQTTAAPNIEIVDGAVVARDDREVLVERRLNRSLIDL